VVGALNRSGDAEAGVHDVHTFDRLASLYDRAMWRPDTVALERGLARAEREVSLVLDVAGGSGRVAAALDREAVVVDAAPGMLAVARDRGLPVVCGDAARLPVRDRAVDAVVVVDALHHVADAEGAVAEAARVLAPGGVLVVRDFDPATLRGRGVELAEHAVGFDSTFRSPEDLTALFEAHGLAAAVVETGFTFTAVGVAPGPGDG
jgi:demethylmenaquinone methyltransferase/2-methoxy-6-polyprenyl-1,4-benzoquinol methylase